jgi:hypothetical protein
MLLLRFLCFSLFVITLRAATPDETARFLAGLPMHGTSLEAIAGQAHWVQHAMEFDDAWRQFDQRSLSKIRAWAPTYLAPQYEDPKGNVFYFFSGPDFLHAQALWPNASTYVLVAREPVGALPDLQKMTPAQLLPALANLHKTLNAVLSWSFFITKDMREDLAHQELNGTLPVLLLFAARAGCKIESVEFIGLDKSGALTAEAKPATRGVKIALFGPHGRSQTLYYFEADLADDMLRKNGAVLKFCESLGRGSNLLKAASYLLHEGGFETIRNTVLSQSDLIVQDDSGIPLRYFDRAKWQLRFCGHYSGPIDTFKQHFQPDLAAAYAQSAPLPMGFSFGYQWQPSRSGLMIARPK